MGGKDQMHPVLNPLYVSTDGAALGTGSPTRTVPKYKQDQQRPPQQPHQPQQRQQHLRRHQEAATRSGTPGRCTQWRHSCWRGTPWLAVLSAAFAAGTLIVWALFADRFVGAGQQVLGAARVQPAVDVGTMHYIIKISVVGGFSLLVGLVLLLSIAVKQRRLAKQQAASPAEWPQGCRARVIVGVSAMLALLLWLAAVALVALCCCTFATWLATLAASMAAQHTLSLQTSPDGAAPLVAYLLAFNKLKYAYTEAARAAPPAVARSPWWAATNSHMMPLLASLKVANGSTLAAASGVACAPSCLDFSPVAKLSAAVSSHSDSPLTCICSTGAVAEVQQLLEGMWRDGLTALAALAALAVLATLLSAHCLVVCVMTSRDQDEALRYDQCGPGRYEGPQDKCIDSWMWQATHSPTSASAISSFPALELQPDVQQQQQQHSRQRPASPEIRPASFGSPSPVKQVAKRAPAAQQQPGLQLQPQPWPQPPSATASAAIRASQADDTMGLSQCQPDQESPPPTAAQLPSAVVQQPQQQPQRQQPPPQDKEQQEHQQPRRLQAAARQLPAATPVTASLAASVPASQELPRTTSSRSVSSGSCAASSNTRRRWQM